MINREFLRTGGLSAALAQAERDGLLRLTSAEERRHSRKQMLTSRAQAPEDVWVFAYGSLLGERQVRIYPPMLAASATWLPLPASATVVSFLPLALTTLALFAATFAIGEEPSASFYRGLNLNGPALVIDGSFAHCCLRQRRSTTWTVRFSVFCGAVPMASAAVLWFGENMSAVPLRNNKAAASAVRSVTVLGATGSIGDSTMDLLRASRDRYQIEALTANSNVEGLAKLAREFGARFAAVADPDRLGELKDALAGTRTECGAGESAIIEAAARPADWVMAAVSGAAGLKPALAAVDRGATVALANKECLVCAGDFFMQRAFKAGACILPADSEHNALFQALASGNREELVRVIITASGGPFRTWPVADIEQATLAQALKHPNWSMGQKITIDSASMMNKGLEVIEASYLFALTPDEIDVLVHPQSIIHGMVEFSDRSVVAQLGAPDMRTPIAHCLGWPDRIVGPAAKLDLAKIGQLTFEAPDFDRFPALRLAYDALRTGQGATTVYNAANEVAVAAFIAGKIKFGAIARLVEATMNDWIRSGNLAPLTSADDAISVDHNARNKAASLLPQIALKAS